MAEDLSDICDELLVIDAQDGNVSAMDELVKRWQKRLWAYAYRLVRDEQGAWDITQQSWVGIIRGLGSLHDAARFKAWAYKIVTNMAARWVRQRASSRRQMDIDEVEAADERQPKSGSGIVELVEKLDAEKRTIISMYYFDELCIADICQILEIPAGTVKSRLYSAREELRRLYKQSLT